MEQLSISVCPGSPPFCSVSWKRAMSLVSPLLGSDYSVDCSASTCYCLLSDDMFRSVLFSATSPAGDGLARWSFLEYQCHLVFSISSPRSSTPAPLSKRCTLCLGTSKHLPGSKIWPDQIAPCTIQSSQLPTQRSLMMSLCGAKRLYSPLDLYHAHIMHMRTHTTYTYARTQTRTRRQTHNLCARSQ